MQPILDLILNILLLIFALLGYRFLIAVALPRITLRLRLRDAAMLGRGLDRYRTPSGRAVLYEPHPAFRKYVPQYLLHVQNSYKLLSCRVDPKIKTMRLTVTMFNCRHRILDVLDVTEHPRDAVETAALLLHPDTSYIALAVEEIDGKRIPRPPHLVRTLPSLIFFFLLFSLITFTAAMLFSYLLDRILPLAFGITMHLHGLYIAYIAASLLCGAVALLMIILRGRKKGIGTVRHGRKHY